MQEGDEAGDLVGLGVHAVLAEDGPGGDVVGGEQVRAGPVRLDSAADGLAVDGDVPPVQPPGGGLGTQPGAHLLISGFGVDGPHRPLDRLGAGRHMPAEPGAVPDPAAAQRLLRHRRRELRGGVHRVRPRQPGHHDHRQDRGQVVPDALGLAVVGHLPQVRQQPVPGTHLQRVEIRGAAAGQHRRVEPGCQRRDPAASQLIQPVRLRLAMPDVPGRPGAAPVSRGGSGRGEVGRGVHRPGMGGGVGERLHRHQPHPEHPLVVAGQRPQHRGQRPRPGVRHVLGGRQHAQTLVAADPLQPRGTLLLIPADTRVTHREPPRSRPERAQYHRHPARLGDVPQHPARRGYPQAVMFCHQRVVLRDLRLRDKTDHQLTRLNSLINHRAVIPQTPANVQLET